MLDLDDDTSSPATLDLALNWLTICLETHNRCRIPFNEQPNWRPTRLIDIGYNGDKFWRLHLSSLPEGQVRYMTLSYRWGSTKCLKLLKKNIHLACQGLPISQLPQTFQDAITVARRLNTRYLWIDALCIVQDSTEDWEREAPTMRYVYSHSICNIAAAAGADQTSELFHGRRTKDHLPGLVVAPSVHPDSTSQKFLLFDKGYWGRRLSQGPLYSRGWVFQECLLAPRVLYFSKDQILWECFNGTKCEGFPQGIPYQHSLKTLTPLWDSIDKGAEKMLSTEGGEMTFQVHSLWNHLLERYSFCELTYAEDRLPALEGIAQLFGSVTGDDYLAGLWRSKLLEQIIWRVPRPKPRLLLLDDVPSWSWASIDGSIQQTGLSFDRKHLVSIIKIEECGTNKGLPRPERWGYLTLTGILSHLCEKDCGQSQSKCFGSKMPDARCYFDTLDLSLNALKEELYLLPILTFHPWIPLRAAATRIVGLILTPSSNNGPRVYRRVGQFTTESLEDIERLGFSISFKGLATVTQTNGATELSLC